MERLTLIGLYNYDNSLFDSCTLPTGIDKELTIDCILNRGGQFETIYPDFDYLKYSMGKWFERHYRTFDKWITALNIEYDPLNNYDRYEESIDNRAYSDSESGAHNQFNSHNQNNSHTEDVSHNEVGSSNLSESNSNSQKANSSSATNGATAGTQGNTVTNTVSAFDSGNFQNKDQQISSGTDSSTTSGNTVTNNLTDENGERQNTSNDIRNSNNNIKSDDNIKSNESLSGNNQLNKNGIDKNQHTAHLYGNIGVTTSQQMLQSELDIARFNIYNEIAELFIEDFCILVY